MFSRQQDGLSFVRSKAKVPPFATDANECAVFSEYQSKYKPVGISVDTDFQIFNSENKTRFHRYARSFTDDSLLRSTGDSLVGREYELRRPVYRNKTENEQEQYTRRCQELEQRIKLLESTIDAKIITSKTECTCPRHNHGERYELKSATAFSSLGLFLPSY